MKAIIQFNKESPTVIRRFDVSKLVEETYAVSLMEDAGDYCLVLDRNKHLPWLPTQCGIYPKIGKDTRFTILMVKDND